MRAFPQQIYGQNHECDHEPYTPAQTRTHEANHRPNPGCKREISALWEHQIPPVIQAPMPPVVLDVCLSCSTADISSSHQAKHSRRVKL